MRLFPPPDPDLPLVVAARSGDVRAFDALVYRYQARMAQFVRARLELAVDVESVTQEIFVTAWRELPSFRHRSRFKTWLYGIALNRCAEAARKHLRLRMALGDLAETTVRWEADAGADPSHEWTHALAERESVREALATLPEPEREVLELYYYAELNLREISQLTDTNLSTVKYRFYQGHRRLRDLLTRNEGEKRGVPLRREGR